MEAAPGPARRGDGRCQRALYVEKLPEPVALVTVDASFISLRILLPVIRNWFLQDSLGINPRKTGEVIALVKPQFEAGRQITSRGEGVIRDPSIHQEILISLLEFCSLAGYRSRGLIRSPLLGPKGNTEFLVWLELSGEKENPRDGLKLEAVLMELFGSL